VIFGALMVGWVGLMVGLHKWQKSRSPSRTVVRPDLVHYPGTEGVPEQESENLGWRKYWFTFGEDYPSKTVYQFYQREMASQGWRLMPDREPEWIRRESKGKARDVFRATWLSPDRLYQLDLDMVSVAKVTREGDRVVSEEREPGMQVYVTLRRVMIPGMLLPPTQPEDVKGEIEAPKR